MPKPKRARHLDSKIQEARRKSRAALKKHDKPAYVTRPTSWTYFEDTCCRLNEFELFLPQILLHCDVDKVMRRIRRIFRALANPQTVDVLCATSKGMINALEASPDAPEVGKYAVHMRTRTNRTNSGRSGGSANVSQFQYFERYAPPFFAGRYCFRPYRQRTEKTLPLDQAFEYLLPQCRLEQGQGKCEAAPFRLEFVGRSGARFHKSHMREYRSDDTSVELRAATSADIALYRFIYASLSPYYHVTVPKDAGRQQRFKTEGVLPVEYIMTAQDHDNLFMDVQRLLMTACMLATHEELEHKLTKVQFTGWRENPTTVRERARTFMDLLDDARILFAIIE